MSPGLRSSNVVNYLIQYNIDLNYIGIFSKSDLITNKQKRKRRFFKQGRSIQRKNMFRTVTCKVYKKREVQPSVTKWITRVHKVSSTVSELSLPSMVFGRM